MFRPLRHLSLVLMTLATAAFAPAAAQTSALTISAVAGTEAVSVRGRAPANATVTVTLLAIISPDLPTIVVSRHETRADANGDFALTVSTAPDYFRGSTIRVVASTPGTQAATAEIAVGPPNPGVPQ